MGDFDMVTCFLNVSYLPNLPFLANGLIRNSSWIPFQFQHCLDNFEFIELSTSNCIFAITFLDSTGKSSVNFFFVPFKVSFHFIWKFSVTGTIPGVFFIRKPNGVIPFARFSRKIFWQCFYLIYFWKKKSKGNLKFEKAIPVTKIKYRIIKWFTIIMFFLLI